MGRNRVFIRIQETPSGQLELVPPESNAGREIHGLSRHGPSGQYYSKRGGKWKYWGNDLNGAVRAFCQSEQPEPPIKRISKLAQIEAEGIEILEAQKEGLDAQHSGTVEVDQKWVEESDHALAMIIKVAQAKRLATPAEKALLGLSEPAEKPISKYTVRDCLNLWLTDHHDNHEEYRKKMTSIVKRFLQVTGNKAVSQLAEQDFADWRTWVEKECKKRSAHWHNEQHSKIGTFFSHVADRKPSWGFPDALHKWLNKAKHKPYKAQKQNRTRLPVEVFNSLLRAAEKWSQADAEKYSPKTRRGMAKRLQAKRAKHRGIQWLAILKLSCQASLDRVDIQRITYDRLKRLDGPLPYLDLARAKAKEQAGGAIDRKIPLLPSVVSALQKVRANDPYPTGFVFKTAEGRSPYTNAGFTKCINRLLLKAGVRQFEKERVVQRSKRKTVKVWEWSFKHLRNVASSLRRQDRMNIDMSDIILGHTVPTEGRSMRERYEDDVNEHYLIPLVNLVGEHYFGGEHVIEE